jgi:fructose/tagatose bisphosphate aldolase
MLLQLEILRNSLNYINEELGLQEGSKPVRFVFHGGSGSSVADIYLVQD